MATLPPVPCCELRPDQVIGKREFRKMRERYNALVNAYAEALEQLDKLPERIGEAVLTHLGDCVILDDLRLSLEKGIDHPEALPSDIDIIRGLLKGLDAQC